MIKAKKLKEGFIYLSTTAENFLIVIEYKRIKGKVVNIESWTEIKGETRLAEYYWNKDGYVAVIEIGKL